MIDFYSSYIKRVIRVRQQGEGHLKVSEIRRRNRSLRSLGKSGLGVLGPVHKPSQVKYTYLQLQLKSVS